RGAEIIQQERQYNWGNKIHVAPLQKPSLPPWPRPAFHPSALLQGHNPPNARCESVRAGCRPDQGLCADGGYVRPPCAARHKYRPPMRRKTTAREKIRGRDPPRNNAAPKIPEV